MSGVLPDGTYDVFVVDATTVDGPGGPGIELALTVLAGEHKSEVVTLTATGLERDEIDLLGMPGTLVVRDGFPKLVLD